MGLEIFLLFPKSGCIGGSRFVCGSGCIVSLMECNGHGQFDNYLVTDFNIIKKLNKHDGEWVWWVGGRLLCGVYDF